MRLLAILAQTLCQTLRQDAQQRIGKVERIHAHVEQAVDRFRGTVGVQGGKHQVTGQRGFDADGYGFLVAHFADHNHVRIRTQKGAHDGGEIQPGFFVDLDLAQTLLGDFNRIFRCPDFGVGSIDKLED